MLSAKTPSPAEWRREAFAESFLSVKPSPRGTSLSAKASNPVVGGSGAGKNLRSCCPTSRCSAEAVAEGRSDREGLELGGGVWSSGASGRSSGGRRRVRGRGRVCRREQVREGKMVDS
jgi:hypothetical protein